MERCGHVLLTCLLLTWINIEPPVDSAYPHVWDQADYLDIILLLQRNYICSDDVEHYLANCIENVKDVAEFLYRNLQERYFSVRLIAHSSSAYALITCSSTTIALPIS